MTTNEEIQTYMVCNNCAVLIANGTVPDDFTIEETERYHASVIANTPEGMHWVNGSTDNTDPFSHLPCECCGSKDGGSRNEAHLMPFNLPKVETDDGSGRNPNHPAYEIRY